MENEEGLSKDEIKGRSLLPFICFLAILAGRGFKDKAPDYIAEKLTMLLPSNKLHAFAYLDFKNMSLVIDYYKEWGLTVPPEIENEYRLQVEAINSLAAQGIFLD